MKIPFIIYADMESLLEKIDTCPKNPKNSSITKINKHTASGYFLFTNCSFNLTKNKYEYYRGQRMYEKLLLKSKKAFNKDNQL